MTTDQLLYAALSNSLSDDYITVDNEFRTLSVPKDITMLGVTSDENGKRLYFLMPAVYGEFNLMDFIIHINYKNVKEDDDTVYAANQYTVTDAEVIGDNQYITFSWLIGRDALMFPGETRFNLCMTKTNEYGYIQNEINTMPATLPVYEGFEVKPHEVGMRYMSYSNVSSDIAVFEEAEERENLESGEKTSVLFGKIKKWFSDLKGIAFSGSYNDLTDVPDLTAATGETLGGIKLGKGLKLDDDESTMVDWAVLADDADACSAVVEGGTESFTDDEIAQAYASAVAKLAV